MKKRKRDMGGSSCGQDGQSPLHGRTIVGGTIAIEKLFIIISLFISNRHPTHEEKREKEKKLNRVALLAAM